jgi:proline iminopeptidase
MKISRSSQLRSSPHGLIRKVLRFALSFILAAAALFIGYASYAYYAYNRVAPQNRACVDSTMVIHVNGFDLYFRGVGADQGLPPVILVHGGPGHSSLSFKNGFDFLGQKTHVFYYDQRGSGNSQIKPNREDYTIEHLVEELESIRRDVVKANSIILVGHSFGSALVQRYAIKYPANVHKMIIISGIRINNSLDDRFKWTWLGPTLYSTALGFPPGDSKAADEWMRPTPENSSDRLFDKTNAHLLEDTGTISFATWYRISLSLTGYNYESELRQMKIPTLFIYGEADSPYTGKPVADELCKLLPNCRSIAFVHSGHWPFLEEPERFRQVVESFLFPN